MPKKRPKRKIKLIGKPLPRKYENLLQRELRVMVKQIRLAIPKLTTPGRVSAFGQILKKAWSDKKISNIVYNIGVRAEKEASSAWSIFDRRRIKQRDSVKTKKPKPYDPDALVDKWTKQATSLITSVRDDCIERMRKDIIQALENEQDVLSLQTKWLNEGIPLNWGTVEGRFKVIAQHQMSSLNAEVQRERATSVGVTEFVWRTQEDDRVREAHEALNGETFSYDKPPSEGLPGQPINCRCYAESVLEDDLLQELGISLL